MTGWPLALVTIGGGIVIGVLLCAFVSAATFGEQTKRIALLRRALIKIASGHSTPEDVALLALETDNELDRTRKTRTADALE